MALGNLQDMPVNQGWNTGVLVVHGIGDQSAGAAVHQAAGPILEVLQHFAILTGSPEPVIQDIDLRPSEGPARLTIGPIYIDGPAVAPTTWLICEANWADSFAAPSLHRMLIWSVTYGFRVIKRLIPGKIKSDSFSTNDNPIYASVVEFARGAIGSVQSSEVPGFLADEDYWTTKVSEAVVKDGLYTQEEIDGAEDMIRASVRRLTRFYSSTGGYALLCRFPIISKLLLLNHTAKNAKYQFAFANASRVIVGSLLVVTIGILFLPLILLLLAIIAVFSLIPGLSSPFQTMRSALERTVGDAFVFTRDPVGQAAMLSSVRRTAEWVEAHCANHVVVAHSQGTVIVEKLFTSGVLDRAKRIAVYGSAIGLLESPSEAWNTSNKWVSFRTPNDPVAPGPLRDRTSLLDDPFKWDRRVRGWNRLSVDHTSYWDEKETFVVEMVKFAAAATGANKLAEWASRVADNAQKWEWPVKWDESEPPNRGFRREHATYIGRFVGVLVLIVGYYTDVVKWVGEKTFDLSNWALSLLPDVFSSHNWLGAQKFQDVVNNAQLLIGVVVLWVLATNITRKLLWGIANRTIGKVQWLRHTQEALSNSSSQVDETHFELWWARFIKKARFTYKYSLPLLWTSFCLYFIFF